MVITVTWKLTPQASLSLPFLGVWIQKTETGLTECPRFLIPKLYRKFTSISTIAKR